MTNNKITNNLSSVYGAYGYDTQAAGAAADERGTSFQESFQSAFKAAESLEDIFREAADTYGVSLNLLKAIGKAESNFNPNAVSSAGAQGVMQLMPATARSLGVENSFDARSNIMGGAKYISSLLERYQGNTVLALSAYNAGMGNVEKYGGIPPFQETQNYVQKVLQYAGEEFDVSSLPAISASGDMQSRAGDADGGQGVVFNLDTARYMVEMMKLQVQNMFFASMEEEEETIL